MYLDVYDQFFWPRGIFRGPWVRFLWFGVCRQRGTFWAADGRGIPYSQAWVRTPLVTVGIYRRAPQQSSKRVFTGILINIPGYKAPKQRWPGWEWRWGWWLEVPQ